MVRFTCRAALTVSMLALTGSILHAAEIKAQLVPETGAASAHKPGNATSAVIWLDPIPSLPALAPGKFTLLQKNKMFTPHLLVVPVGSSVAFPNADPFFHNVFSLFDGKRFDLGLYEAGSTRSVVFSRPGVSYIFCNIHSEMSAVVIALNTPFYGIADPHGAFHIQNVPDGDYSLRVWVEGQQQSSLDRQTRRIHITGTSVDLGDIRAGSTKQQHLNKFGRPYEPDAVPTYE
jgi:plastocyanin